MVKVAMDDEILRKTLVDNFLMISGISRESGDEERIANFFVDVAKERGLYCFKDEHNNVLIKKGGVTGTEPIALQSHLDMVYVDGKDGSHNSRESGVDVTIDGDRVAANGTSLGADQGVGLAMMLAIMEDDSPKHPDLEFMFTTEEETTFGGAANFSYSLLRSKRLINLDNSKDNSVFIGTDGDVCNEYTYCGDLIENELPGYKILMDGFPGGNSGENVGLSENNAITAMARLLADKDIFLGSINGGTFENDLATSCEAIINTHIDVDEIFRGANIKIQNFDNKISFSKQDSKNILKEILDLRCGYISRNQASANLELVRVSGNKVSIRYIFRSMDAGELESINSATENLQNGFTVHEIYTDSIWKPDYDSKLLKQYEEQYFKECGEYPIREVWCGGIECSAIKSRVEDMDMISIGANIEKYHTVDEVTYVSSWLKVYKLLTRLLGAI